MLYYYNWMDYFLVLWRAENRKGKELLKHCYIKIHIQLLYGRFNLEFLMKYSAIF